MSSLSKNLMIFNSHTAARDKIFRFVQYGSRLILWQLTYGSPDVKGGVITRLRKLEGALGLSRKLFRLGNCIDLAHKASDALSIPELGMRLLTFTSQVMKALWLLIDHLLWFSKVGLVNVDQIFWNQWSLRAWLIALTTASIADMIKLQGVQNKLHRHRKEFGKDAKISDKLQIEMHSVRMNFWRDFCDLFIPLGGLSYVSPGFSALTGVVSSVIGFKQEWEKHIQPFKPQN
ncbi:peroxisomal membrane protein 11A-like [Physella acuta]|uniref:peroxisomal membrane protein 11A-like n=1 Tax=Physella acuta TaxID=109671 RepID=UPI0027DDC2B6|nr:peroxisomal membrane protein 11A-like [Physella acuta]